MKKLYLLSLIVLTMSCSKGLEEDVVYQFNLPPTELLNSKIVSDNNEYSVLLSNATVLFDLKKENQSRMLLVTDSIFSLKGEYSFSKNKDKKDVYSFAFKDNEGVELNFNILSEESIVFTQKEESTLNFRENIFISEVEPSDFNQAIEIYLNSTFFPLQIAGKTFSSKDIDDYWLKYLFIEEEIEKRDRVRKELARQREIERMIYAQRKKLEDFINKKLYYNRKCEDYVLIKDDMTFIRVVTSPRMAIGRRQKVIVEGKLMPDGTVEFFTSNEWHFDANYEKTTMLPKWDLSRTTYKNLPRFNFYHYGFNTIDGKWEESNDWFTDSESLKKQYGEESMCF